MFYSLLRLSLQIELKFRAYLQGNRKPKPKTQNPAPYTLALSNKPYNPSTSIRNRGTCSTLSSSCYPSWKQFWTSGPHLSLPRRSDLGFLGGFRVNMVVSQNEEPQGRPPKIIILLIGTHKKALPILGITQTGFEVQLEAGHWSPCRFLE